MESKSSNKTVSVFNTIPTADMKQLAVVIRELVVQFPELDKTAQLSTLNLIMRLAFGSPAEKENIVIPPFSPRR